MTRVEKTVFLSYRRTNFSWALAVYQSLSQCGFDVFFDFNSIKSGDFERIIFENIRSRAHFVIILTPLTLGRCDEPEDLLRREIEEAITYRRNIVPLMFEDFSFKPTSIANTLPRSLTALRRYNGLSVPIEYFDAAMSKLGQERLNVQLDAVLHPASVIAQKAAKVQQLAAATAPRLTGIELTGKVAAFDTDPPGTVAAAPVLKPEQRVRELSSPNSDSGLLAKVGALAASFRKVREGFMGADDFFNRANGRCEKGDLNGAVQDYREALLLKPDAGTLNNLAVTLSRQGDHDTAMEVITKAIGLDPKYAMAYSNRARWLEERGDLEGAEQDYSEAIRLRSDNGEDYAHRGGVRASKRDWEGAAKDYTDALLHHKSLTLSTAAAVFNNRGNARRKLRDAVGAVQDFNYAIQLTPGNPDMYFNRALARDEAGDHEGANKDRAFINRLKDAT